MKRVGLVIVIAFVFSTLGCDFASAQGTAQVGGTVRDQSGAVLPGVEVTATETETGLARKTVTNETGSYVLPNLPIGPYRLEATLPGFRTFVQTGIVLQVNSNPVINPILEVGQVAEQVQVEANATQVETRSAGVGQVVETQRILDLPLNGRQVTDLITLSGAAVSVSQFTGNATTGYIPTTGVNISVGGSQDFGVQYSLDGAEHNNIMDGTSMPLPFPDALQEFRFSTSTQDASNGMHSGAAVSAVLKSGTNAFHGDAFEFVRNNDFNARDFFAVTRDNLKRNQFGGTIGGPLQKDKLFFFAGYQETTTRQSAQSTIEFVPTPQMLAGDFTTFASPACNNGRQVTLKAPFVNNQINPALFSPAALKIAARLPQARDACGTFLTGPLVHENDYQAPVRVDYQVSPKQSLFARYMLTWNRAATPYTLRPSDVLVTNSVGANDRMQSLALGQTYLFGSNIVNSARLVAHRTLGNKLPINMFGPADVGINMYTYSPHFLNYAPSGAFSIGYAGYYQNSLNAITQLGGNDDLSIVKGPQQIALGVSYLHTTNEFVDPTFGPGMMTSNGSVTGTGMTDFFTGNLNALRQANPINMNLSQNFFGTYAQSTWRMTKQLTMTYGLRWEPFFPMSFRHGDVYNFSLAKFYAGQKSNVVPTAPPGFTYPGDPGFNGKSGLDTKWGTFDPRIGLAWDPAGDGKTAIRIGAGMAHDFVRQSMHVNTSSVQPFNLTVVQSGINLDNPYATFPGGDPFPYFYNKNAPRSFTPYGSYFPIPPDMKTQRQYSWNFGIQRQVTPDLFVSGSYIGTHIIHLWALLEYNPAQFIPGNCVAGQYGLTAPGPCSTASNVNQRRILNLQNPSANLSYLTAFDDGGTQGYNGMLLNMRWRHGQNINLNANYTLSHCIGLPAEDSTSNLGGNFVHQPYQNNGSQNRDLDIANCSFDRRQIFNTTMVTRTPRFANNALRTIASDWSFSTIYQQRSGAPLTIVIGTDVALNGFGANGGSSERPNQVLGNPYSNRSSLTNYLNPAAFAVPATGTYGNMGASNILGPGFWEWDEAVSRQFQVREGQTVEFRAEAFNITNSLRPGNPGVSLGSANTFGRITGEVTGVGPRIMQFALKYVF